MPKRNANDNNSGKKMLQKTQNQTNSRYKEFDTVEQSGWDGGWYYQGDGKEQEDFFKQHSNFDELINNMSAEERNAWEDYWVPGHFMDGQQYRGWDNMRENDRRLTKIYDDVLDKSELNHGVILTRRSDAQLVMGAGHRTASLDELRAMEGRDIDCAANMSFGAAKHGLTIGDNSKKIEYKLAIPGGTKGAGMWIADRRINSFGTGQLEFMSNRDIVVKVGKTTYDKKRGVYTVNLKYVGRKKHDYGSSR